MLQRLAVPGLNGRKKIRSIYVCTALAVCGAACMGGALKPREVCLRIEAGPSLNLFDGEAHALNLLIYPLTGPAGFEGAPFDDLVAGRGVQGATGPPMSLMLNPGEVREVREVFPPTTGYAGVVANYYHQGSDSPGNRRVVIEGKCSLFGMDEITLTARDLLVD